MHYRTGQCAIGARSQAQMHIGLLGARCAVRVNDVKFGAPILACLGDVRHDVDLGRDGIAAPHHDHVGNRHFTRIGTGYFAASRHPARSGRRHADCLVFARIAQCVAETMDNVALHQPHSPGKMIWPDSFRAIFLFGLPESFGDDVQGVIPADRFEFALALGPDTP